MFCKQCGASLADNVSFCDKCGAKIEAAPQAAPKAAPTMNVPVRDQKPAAAKSNAVPILILGIVSLVTLILDLVIPVPFIDGILFYIAGIICASIARKQAKQLAAKSGELNGMAKAGKIMASIGLPVNIIALIAVVAIPVISWLASLFMALIGIGGSAAITGISIIPFLD